MIEKIYTKDEIKGANIKTVRSIASGLKIRNITSYSKEELVEKILDAQQSLINAGIVKAPKQEIKQEKQDAQKKTTQKKEKPDQEQLNLDLESVSVPKEKAKASKSKEPKEKTKIEEKPKLTEEELQEQRRKSVEKRRKEMGYIPPEEKQPKVEKGGEHLTVFMNIAVPIALLVAVYCGLEIIIFILSKLWYGDLAYVPINLALKIILCIISVIIIEVAKYTQKFDKVIDYYANKLKNK